METEEKGTLDFGAIDFTPDWAKKGAGVSVGRVSPVREDSPGRKPFDRRQGGGARPFGNAAGGARKPGGAKPFGRPAAGPQAGGRPGFRRNGGDAVRPLDAEVKILPEPRALGTVIRKLQQDAHAYKLKDIAYFLLDNPSSVLVKVTPRGRDSGQAAMFHQCKACGFAAMSAEEAAEHAVSAHMADYYDSVEVDCEPPKGNFPCVAKCSLSGVLLGPPNLHDFAGIVREMIRTRYPDMSEEQYRSHIEMVRDPEAVEEWRKGAVRKTVFTAKGAGEDAPRLTREQAESEFRRTILHTLTAPAKSISLTADIAMKSPCRPLVMAIGGALEAERRAPYSMCFALRGAFHHRKLHFFRANDARGPEFVTGMELKEFSSEHAVPALAKVANFIADHPCSPMVDIVSGEEDEKSLSWLVSTGHVVAFTNGVYSAVEKFPKYGPQWQKRTAKQKPAAKAEAPQAEKPAVAVEAPQEKKPAATAEAPQAENAAVADSKKEEAKDEVSPQLAE